MMNYVYYTSNIHYYASIPSVLLVTTDDQNSIEYVYKHNNGKLDAKNTKLI